ncbi:hypothetical protein NM688_g4160 [Phlebia brevispora]|uniref:Uncharacterized protein n=1 Tax=Phlebia brevispora TaxID=194682 RepID=A0ACC1T4A8_9APHY|nr:hypothetical protein NM688_g4160 [Phlebia brevispora]
MASHNNVPAFKRLLSAHDQHRKQSSHLAEQVDGDDVQITAIRIFKVQMAAVTLISMSHANLHSKKPPDAACASPTLLLHVMECVIEAVICCE